MAACGEARHSSDATRVWALASGKGGVGKSFLAANLGCLLAESDWPTVVVDLDQEGANLHTYLGVEQLSEGIDAALTGARPLEQLCRPHEVPGLRYVGGCAGARPATSAQRGALIDALRALPERAVVLDLPTGTSPQVLDFFLAADVPLLIVTPEPASVENVYHILRAIYLRTLRGIATSGGHLAAVDALVEGQPRPWRPDDLARGLDRIDPALRLACEGALAKEDVGLVVNQVRHDDDLRLGERIAAAAGRQFGLKLSFLAAIAQDPGAWLAVRRRKLMLRDVEDELITQGLALLADRIIEGAGSPARRGRDLAQLAWSQALTRVGSSGAASSGCQPTEV